MSAQGYVRGVTGTQAVETIDPLMHDKQHQLSCYFLPGPRPTLVEPGPESCLDRVIAALDDRGVGPDDLANIVVTHVHLDHGGGAGRLAEHFPSATVFVHTEGARHLRSPERLWNSATRVYGEERMEELWGSMTPVPELWEPGKTSARNAMDKAASMVRLVRTAAVPAASSRAFRKAMCGRAV